MLFIFTTAVHTGMLGALLTFARSPLYSWYSERAVAPPGSRGSRQADAAVLETSLLRNFRKYASSQLASRADTV